MKPYIEVCCHSRLYNDQTQVKVHMESQAILSILNISKKNIDLILKNR